MAVTAIETPQDFSLGELLRPIKGAHSEIRKRLPNATPYDFSQIVEIFAELETQTEVMAADPIQQRTQPDSHYLSLLQTAQKFTRLVLSINAPQDLRDAAGQCENYQPFLHASERILRALNIDPHAAPALPADMQNALKKASQRQHGVLGQIGMLNFCIS